MTITADNFADFLKTQRSKKKITQNDLAKDLNLSAQIVSHYEIGFRKPSLETAKNICEYFKIPLSELDLATFYKRTNNKTQKKSTCREWKITKIFKKLLPSKNKIKSEVTINEHIPK